MKINLLQKIVLGLYIIVFVYFTILHVPFEGGYGTVKYDTLFSNNSNLDIERLVLIIIIISLLSTALFLFFRNTNFAFSVKPIKNKLRPIIYISLILLLLASIFIFIKKQKHEAEPANKIVIADSSTPTLKNLNEKQSPSPIELLRAKNCTKENALYQFYSYMKFYYPDWKIYGKPITQKSSDCKFEIQFTTMDPHIKLEKEIIIVEISFSFDGSEYYFNKIRGTLY